MTPKGTANPKVRSRRLRRPLAAFFFTLTALAAEQASELKRTCTRCHNLDVVRAQRLSREEWEMELAKMSSMGANIKNRAALLDYLTRKYGPERKQPTVR
ncbi:MAG: hypothetical protein ABJF23_09340 [Bryobacteraceae bacterium]